MIRGPTPGPAGGGKRLRHATAR